MRQIALAATRRQTLSSEGVLLVCGAWCGAGAGREDVVRLVGCEGSVSLAWRAGVDLCVVVSVSETSSGRPDSS